MSLLTSLNELSDEVRHNILKELCIKLQKNFSWIRCFDIDDDDNIYLPFTYALNHGFKRRPRSDFVVPSRIKFQGVLRDYQQGVKRKVIEYLNTNGSCILSLHVGWGKSIFSIYLATRLRLKTLIIVNRILLIQQWITSVENVCGKQSIQFIKPGDILDDCCYFYIVNCQNIPKLGKNYFRDIGTLICDEVHLLCAKTLFKSFFYVQPRYVLALSATPYRPDELTTLIKYFFGTNLVTKTLYRKHQVYTIYTGYELEYKLNFEGQTDWNSLLESQCLHEERNKQIVNLSMMLKDRHILILCKRIQHRSMLVKMLQELGEDVFELVNKNNDIINARILVGTVQKCGVGFDHAKLDTLIIAADMEEYYIQYMGRVFRRPDVNAIIFDFVDKHPSLKRHYLTRKRVYKQCGATITDQIGCEISKIDIKK